MDIDPSLGAKPGDDAVVVGSSPPLGKLSDSRGSDSNPNHIDVVAEPANGADASTGEVTRENVGVVASEGADDGVSTRAAAGAGATAGAGAGASAGAQVAQH